MNSYELAVIFHPELSEEQVDSVLEKASSIIHNHNGEIISRDKWGKRKLAYFIEKQREGNYVFVVFKIEPAAVAEVSRMLKVESGVMRFLIVKKIRIKSRKKEKVSDKSENKEKEKAAEVQ